MVSVAVVHIRRRSFVFVSRLCRERPADSPKSNDYFSVAIAYCQPIILERTQELKTLKRLSNLHSNIKAKMKLYAPSLGVAEITGRQS